MSSAELALWARVDDFDCRDLPQALWEHRNLVKTWGMRGTLHLLPSTELPLWQGALATSPRYLRPALWRRGALVVFVKFCKIGHGCLQRGIAWPCGQDFPHLLSGAVPRDHLDLLKNQQLYGCPPSLVMISRMPSSESWSGCLFSARAISFTLEYPAI